MLFEQIQNENNVGLDVSRFLELGSSDKLQLFLERKLIPKLLLFKEKEMNIDPVSYFSIRTEFRDIVAHFVTNLCGGDHSWLRRYCIDYLSILSNFILYNWTVLAQIAVDLTDYKSIVTNNMTKTLSLIL